MKILVLEGSPNTGKTTTINIAYQLVKNNGGIPTNKQPLGEDPNDISDIMNYKGLQIAFFSMGDISNELSKAITRYANLGCDILICALSTVGSKKRANNKINKFNNQRFTKTAARTSIGEQQANNSDAQIIYSEI